MTLLIGGPVGLLSMCACLLAIYVYVFDQNPWMLMILFIYIKPMAYMALVMLLSLWFVGRYIERCVLRGQALLVIAFKSSMVVSFAMWFTYAITVFVQMNSIFETALYPTHYSDLKLPVVGFVSTVLLSTFTIALLIAFIVRRRVLKAFLKEANKF
jgi:hypothetical protein